MKTRIGKLGRFIFVMFVILALALPRPVLAQDGEPTDTPVPTEVVTEEVVTEEVVTEEVVEEPTTEPTEVIVEEPTETEAVLETEMIIEETESVETEIPVETEITSPTEVTVSLGTEAPLETGTEEPITVQSEEESVIEIVEELNAEDAVILDEDGNPVALGSAEAEEALTVADPWFIGTDSDLYGYFSASDGCETWVRPLRPDSTPYPEADVHCKDGSDGITTPIQAAINDTKSTGSTIFLSGSFSETLTITKNVTLDGQGLTTITTPVSGGSQVWGSADITDGSTKYYGLIYIAKGTSVPTVNILNLTLNNGGTTNLSDGNNSYYAGILINNAVVNLTNLVINGFVATNNGGKTDDGVGVLVYKNPGGIDRTTANLVTLDHDTISNNEYGIYTVTTMGGGTDKYSWVVGDSNNFISNTKYSLEFPHGRLLNGYWGFNWESYFEETDADTESGCHFKYDMNKDGDVTDTNDVVACVYADCKENMGTSIVYTGATLINGQCQFEGTPLQASDFHSSGSYTTVYSKANFNDFKAASLLGDIEPYEVWPMLTEELPASALSLVKTASSLTFDQIGQLIAYTYTLTNEGNTTLTGFSVTDDKLTVDCSEGEDSLAPGESTECYAAYTIVEADLLGTGITNIATAHALYGTTTVDSEPQTVTITPVVRRALNINKEASETSYDDTSDILHYTYTITNIGNVTLSGQFTVTDNKLNSGNPFNCGASDAELTPGDPTDTVVCSAVYYINQADLDNGSVTNIAYASLGDLDSLTDELTVGADIKPGLALVKTADETSYDDPSDILHYHYTIRNIGNVTLTGQFTVTDNKINGGAAFFCDTDGALAPGGTKTCTANYAVTQADIENGKVVNTAFASLDKLVSNPVSLTVDAIQRTSIAIEKTVDKAFYYNKDEILTYTFTITNTGNVTLTGQFMVKDERIKGDEPFNCGASDEVLTPGLPIDTVTCTVAYTITQDDMYADDVTNYAHAIFGTVESTVDDATVLRAKPELTIVKAVGETSYDDTSDILHYTYTITNTGNVPLSGQFKVTDNKIGTFSCGASDVELTPGDPTDNVTCTAGYAITQADIDAGAVTNTAYASLGTLNSPSVYKTVIAIQRPDLTLAKTVSPGTYSTVGDKLYYSYLVTNSGNVTLTDLGIDDNRIEDDATNITCLVKTLTPGATTTCIATYTIIQADLDTGMVTNLANAVAKLNTTNVVSNKAFASATADQKPALTIVKTVDEASYDEITDTLTYHYAVTNSGNITLTGQFQVSDDKINGGVAFDCGLPTTLAPLQTVTCSALYPITQADIDAGFVKNTASAQLGKISSGPVDKTVNALQNPAISVLKTITSAGPYTTGSTITYNILITNTGNLTLLNVNVDDPNGVIGTCTPAIPVASLAPGGTISCDASHVVTAADLAAGTTYLNVATVTTGDWSQSSSVTATLTPQTTTIVPTPILVPVTGAVGGLIPVTGGQVIVSGLGHSCMGIDGQVVCWGLNTSGQLGDGTTTNRSVPVYVKDLDGVANLTAGSEHTCALNFDGEVWCWGKNGSGQLGNGKTANSSVPVQVTGLPGKAMILTAGEEFTCALMSNNEVWCWGNNSLGQLNDGTTTNRSTPVKSQVTTNQTDISGGKSFLLGNTLVSVDSWKNVVSSAITDLGSALSISANRWEEGGCAVSADSTVKCWSSDLASALVPEAPLALMVSDGLAHGCAINTDSTVSCWGANADGELGNGSFVDSKAATLVKDLNGVNALAAGAHHNCALVGTYNVPMCWGANNYGQLGNDSNTNSSMPVMVVLP